METVGVIIGILVLLGLFFVVWAAKSFKDNGIFDINEELPTERTQHEQAPYKLEPPEPAEQLAVPVATLNPLPKPERKRKYTKRSTYWTSSRVKTKMRKARAAKKRKTGHK